MIPPESQAGVLLSPKLLMGKLMMSAFKYVWHNCKDDDFTCDSEVLQLKAGHEFDLPSIRHDASTYTPRLEQLTIKVFSNSLQVDSYTTCPVSPGITSTCQSSQFHTIVL